MAGLCKSHQGRRAGNRRVFKESAAGEERVPLPFGPTEKPTVPVMKVVLPEAGK
jgi:hypothetical protein